MKETFKNTWTIALCTAMGIGFYALSREKHEEPIKLIRGESTLTQLEGYPSQVDYFTDGSRELRLFDSQNNVIRVYQEHCDHGALIINEMSPVVAHPASDKDFTFELGVIEKSPKCDDDVLTPSDFAGNPSSLE